MTSGTPARMPLGRWTVLAQNSEAVRATITRERENYTVRDARGLVLGQYATAHQALSSVAN